MSVSDASGGFPVTRGMTKANKVLANIEFVTAYILHPILRLVFGV